MRFTIGALVGIVLGALLAIGTVGGFIAGAITALCAKTASEEPDEPTSEEEVTAT